MLMSTSAELVSWEPIGRRDGTRQKELGTTRRREFLTRRISSNPAAASALCATARRAEAKAGSRTPRMSDFSQALQACITAAEEALKGCATFDFFTAPYGVPTWLILSTADGFPCMKLMTMSTVRVPGAVFA